MTGALPRLLLGVILMTGTGEASTPPSQLYPIKITTYWWETPAHPDEKWLQQRGEKDEWYKHRHEQKYRDIR